MKCRFLAFTVVVAVAGSVAAAPALTIQPAVAVSFDGSRDRLYQVEATSNAESPAWTAVGSSHIGKGKPVTQTILTSATAYQFFRTQEYNLTNQLVAFFPFDGTAVDESVGRNRVWASFYYVDRFGEANRAALLGAISTVHTAEAIVKGFAPSTNDFTISLWVAGHRFVGPPERVLTSSTQLALIRADSNSLELYIGKNTVALAVSPPLEWEATRWYCFKVVRASSVFKVYRDDELVTSGSSSFAYDERVAWNLKFGPRYGGVDEVRLYNRALSPDELAALSRVAP